METSERTSSALPRLSKIGANEAKTPKGSARTPLRAVLRETAPRFGSVSVFVAIILEVVVVLGLVALARIVSVRFDALSQLARAQAEAVQQLGRQSTLMAADGETLRGQVADLRAFVASRSAEDVIFLKTVIIKPKIDRPKAREIARLVHKYAALHGQDPDLVLAMIAVESDFNPEAVSNMGATGLMQVMPQWKKVLGIQEPLTDPETSIKYGLQILGFYKSMYKDIETALTAYNRGPGPVDAALMRGRDPTNKYVPRVMKTYEILRALTVGEA
ncbi:MAG: lytic transglycosylase domain-containing protein [Deltaproteobacteria bacterium]|nr:lytic transglycosylase domain-containing protein [Deltaproteobacteria bacterium]